MSRPDTFRVHALYGFEKGKKLIDNCEGAWDILEERSQVAPHYATETYKLMNPPFPAHKQEVA